MKKVLAKIVSIVLLIVLVFTMVISAAGSEKSVVPVTKDVVTYSEIRAKELRKVFGRLNNEKWYAELFYETMQTDDAFLNLIRGWKVLHFVDSPMSGKLSQQEIYEMALFDLLDVMQNSNSMLEGVTEEAKSYIDVWEREFSDKVGESFTEIQNALIEGDKRKTFIEVGKRFLPNCTDIVFFIADMGMSVSETLSMAAKFQTSKKLSEAVEGVLVAIANDATNPKELCAAARKAINYFSMSDEELLEQAKEATVFTLAKKVVTYLVDKAWDDFLSGMGIPGVTIVTKGLLVLSDAVFEMDEKFQLYFQLGATIQLENAVWKFIENCDEENFEEYLRGVDFYKRVVLQGYDYSIKMVEVEKNALGTKFLQLIGFSNNTPADYDNAIAQVKSFKQGQIEKFSAMEAEPAVLYSFCNSLGMVIEECPLVGNAYYVSKPEQLGYISYIVYRGNNLAGYTISLQASIDLTSKSWYPIGTSATPYCGSFNGNGYAIHGVNTSNHLTGLFGHVTADNSYFKDATLYGYVSGNWDSRNAAGLISVLIVNENGSFNAKNIRNHIDVNNFGEGTVGGLISTISSYGNCNVDITGCHNYGSITNYGKWGPRDAGGLVGNIYAFSNDNYTFYQCLQDSIILQTAGGGYSTGNAGGLLAHMENGNLYITQCAVVGEIYAQAYGPGCGGLIGYMKPHSFTIENCEMFAYIHCVHNNGDSNQAGLVGGCYADYYDSTSKWIIRNSYVSAVMEGSYGKAALVINNERNGASLQKITVENCYFDVGKTSITSNRMLAWTALLSGCNTISTKVTSSGTCSSYDLKTSKSLYSNWDFENVWTYAPSGYPVLQVFDCEPCASHSFDYDGQTVMTAPTCSSTGTAIAYCENCHCSISYTLQEDSNNHISYENGICTACGAYHPDAEIVDGVVYLDKTVIDFDKTRTNIVLKPDTVGIVTNLFKNCSTLISIEISPVMASIDANTFYGCKALETVIIPADSQLKTIGSHAFENCQSLAAILLPDSLIEIADGAFNGCSRLSSITIPESVSNIGANPFVQCSSLETITVAPENSSYYCAGNCLIEIESKTLVAGYKGSVLPTDGSVKAIGDYAFSKYMELDKLTLPSAVVEIGKYSFSGCSNLLEVILHNQVAKIDKGAFQNCDSLKHITLPDSVSYLGDSAFSGCVSLTSIQLSNALEKISGSTFSECSALMSIIIPDSVTSIGRRAFRDCYSLEKIVIPDGVASIGLYAFYNCFNLKEIILPFSVTSVGSYAFSNCTGLTSVTISGSVTSVGSHAFSNCIGLTSVTISGNVTSMSDSVFNGCENIRTATVPTCALTGIPATSLKTVIITSGETIENYALYYCERLTTVVVPNSVTSIGDGAFLGCTSLTSIVIPDSVTSIGDDAFGTSTTLHVYDGSYAHAWAKENNHPYVLIEKLIINSAQLNLSNDINLLYTVTVPEEYENPYMVFEMNGKTHTVTEYTQREDGRLVFNFGALRAQYFGDNVKATLYATMDGAEYSTSIDSYSAKAYCANVLKKYADDAKLVRLVSDLLAYAEAVQTYDGYKTDAPITGGVTVTPSTFLALDASLSKKALLGTKDPALTWKSVGARLENTMAVYVRFALADAEGATVHFSVAGREAVAALSDEMLDAEGYYLVSFSGIKATEFDETLSVSIQKDGVAIGQTVTYSINSYALSTQNSTDESLRHLVERLYRYGVSAEVYAGKHTEHVWDEGVETKEPTVDAEGEITYTCHDCGETKIEPIPKLPFGPGSDPAGKDKDWDLIQ